MNRKQRRAMEKKVVKKNSQKLAEKIFQFDQLPDHCLVCAKAYDKTNKEMASTWNVVVATSDVVRLYCPDCWGAARRVTAKFRDQIEGDNK